MRNAPELGSRLDSALYKLYDLGKFSKTVFLLLKVEIITLVSTIHRLIIRIKGEMNFESFVKNIMI